MTNPRRALATLLRLASLVTVLGVGCTAETGLGNAARDISRHGDRRNPPNADRFAAESEEQEQALLAATDEEPAAESAPVEPESDVMEELIGSDDSVRCGDGVLDEEELCDISIPDGEEGACPTECPALDECHEPALAVRGCWTQCVLGKALPCD